MDKKVLSKVEESKDTVGEIGLERIPHFFKDVVIKTDNYQGYIYYMQYQLSGKLVFTIAIARKNVNMWASSWNSQKHDKQPVDYDRILLEENLSVCVGTRDSVEKICKAIVDEIENTGLAQEVANKKLSQFFKED